MTESATLRAAKRRQTEHRITVCAQRLTEERGLDGFTMDELADAAEVSRRTLFNYFPSKLDAVLGNMPEVPPDAVATFCAGGPHGHLLDDLGELAVVVLSTKDLSREDVELGQRVFHGNPRLVIAAHERFEAFTGEFVDLVLDREGAGLGRDKARLLVRLLVSVFDCTLAEGALPAEGADGTDGADGGDGVRPLPERPLAEAFRETLATARALMA